MPDSRDWVWLVVAIVLDGLLALADRAVGGIASTFLASPLLLAVVGRPRWAAAAGALSVLLAACSGAGTAAWGDVAYWSRLSFVAAGSILAVVLAERRRRTEATARRVTSLEAIAGVVDASVTAVITMDAAGRVTTFNPAATEMFGYRADEAIGQVLAELVVPPRLRAAHEAGLARYLATGQGRVLGRPLELPAVRADGTEFPVELSITSVPGPATSFAGFIRDMTDQRRDELHRRLLSQTAELLASSIDYERTLREVAGLAVPEIADWCGVSLPGIDGRMEPLAVAHQDPAKLELLRELRRRYPAPPETDPLRAVMRTGEASAYPTVTDEELAAHARDPEHLELLRAVGVTSALVVPLRSGRRTIGTLSFVRSTPDRPFDDRDLAFGEELARRAGAAVENARLYAERTEVAETLKAALKPPAMPPMEGWDAATLYQPASRSSELGGDFYDVFSVADGWMLVMGDVLGKGATAAALTSLARYSIRTAATLTGSPSAALDHLNADLARQDQTGLLSAVCIRLDDTATGAKATIASAGHPLPILVSEGRARFVGEPSLLLGVRPDARCEESTIRLEPGERIVLYTDGVLDLVGEADRFGEERLLRTVEAQAASSNELVDRTATALARFATGPQPDDIAMLVVGRVAAAPAAPASTASTTPAEGSPAP